MEEGKVGLGGKEEGALGKERLHGAEGVGGE